MTGAPETLDGPVPTEPGAYWWKRSVNDHGWKVRLMHVKGCGGRLCIEVYDEDEGTDDLEDISRIGGVWSRRLVEVGQS